MDIIILGVVLCGAGYFIHRHAKREGSRKGYAAGRRRRRR